MTVYKTRLSIIWSVLRPSRVPVIVIFAALGMIGNWSLAVLTGNPHYLYLWDVIEEYVSVYTVVSLLYEVVLSSETITYCGAGPTLACLNL